MRLSELTADLFPAWREAGGDLAEPRKEYDVRDTWYPSGTRPGLAHVLDTFQADGVDCVVSERLDGRPLAEVARL